MGGQERAVRHVACCKPLFIHVYISVVLLSGGQVALQKWRCFERVWHIRCRVQSAMLCGIHRVMTKAQLIICTVRRVTPSAASPALLS